MNKQEKALKGLSTCADSSGLCINCVYYSEDDCTGNMARDVLELIKKQPKEIGYKEKADALLKMWMDDDITDYEYGKIMDKLNKKR